MANKKGGQLFAPKAFPTKAKNVSPKLKAATIRKSTKTRVAPPKFPR